MKPILALKNRPCVYAIINKMNGKIYIGKTSCIYKRCYQYLNAFKKRDKSKINTYLLNSFNKYGIDNFEMSPIEFCSIEEISIRELHWMCELQTTNPNKGYNLRLDSSTGMITHIKTSEKISNNLKKQWASGIRDDHSDKMKNIWKNDEKRKAKQSRMFKEYKTRYCYVVDTADGNCFFLDYKGLKSFRLHTSVISCFNRHSGDTHLCKGYVVKRINYVKSKT